MYKIKKSKIANNAGRLYILALVFLMVPVSVFAVRQSAVAACSTALPTSRGQATATIDVPTAGTYRVWSRIKAPDTSSNSYGLQIDDVLCNVRVGDSSIAANTWVWVDYQNGSSSSKINVALSAGRHAVTMAGTEDGVVLDRIILTADTACIPTGMGDNCAVVSIVNDLNSDGSVNVFDLSILLSKWGATSTNAADLNNDGTVNIFDLSMLLSAWTG